MGNSQDVLCPQCQKSDLIRNVPDIYLQGTTESDTSEAAIDSASYSTERAASLVAKLSPPRAPRKPRQINLYWLILFAVFTFVGVAAAAIILIPIFPLIQSLFSFDTSVAGEFAAEILLSFLLVAFLLAMGLLSFLIIRSPYLRARERNKKRIEGHNDELSQWQRALEKWGRIYYCHRDEIVFDPADYSYSKVDQLLEFLYEES